MSNSPKTYFNPRSIGKLFHTLAEAETGVFLKLVGGDITGDIVMKGNAVKEVSAPVENGDAANKEYVDTKNSLVTVEWHFPAGTGILIPTPLEASFCFPVVPLKRKTIIKVVAHVLTSTVSDSPPMTVTFYLRYTNTAGANIHKVLGQVTYTVISQTDDAMKVAVVNHDFDLSEIIATADADPICGYLVIEVAATGGAKNKSLVIAKIID